MLLNLILIYNGKLSVSSVIVHNEGKVAVDNEEELS